ncbi:MAG: DUF4168 domain-containing protein [Desulfuromonadaceae bacterium]
MHTKSIALMFALIFTLLCGFATTGSAQPDYAQNQQATMQGAEQMEIDDSTLEQFVGVAKDLGAIRDEYVKKFEGIEDQQKAQSLQTEMSQKMVSVVDNSQLDVKTYNYIANQMNVDEELRNKVQEML